MEELLELLSDGTLWGVAAGVAAGAAAFFGRGFLRPVAKGAIKGYLAVSDQVRTTASQTGEGLQQLVREARSEYEQSRMASEENKVKSARFTPDAGSEPEARF
jgi:hypothetical protein